MNDITKAEAIEIAKKYIDMLNSDMNEDQHQFLLLDEIIEKNYGWLFPYGNKRYVETRDSLYVPFEYYPFLVEKAGGMVVEFLAIFSLGDPLEHYEKTGKGERKKII